MGELGGIGSRYRVWGGDSAFPIVSIVVPFFGEPNLYYRILTIKLVKVWGPGR